jgi:hypothetical protein
MGFITQLTSKLIREPSQLILDKHDMTGSLANGGHSNDAGIILYFISPSRGKHSLRLVQMDFYSMTLTSNAGQGLLIHEVSRSHTKRRTKTGRAPLNE